MKREIKVAFVGNPNCGKTTLFNSITGARLKVANWPGVTVEKVEGSVECEGCHLSLMDTPGIYSLSSYSIEEKVTRQCVLEEDIDVIVNVIDASSMERNLYLTLQLLEIGKPVVLAMNMMDIVKERGMEIDMHRMPEMLGGIPVVPVSAVRKEGLDILLHAVVHHFEEGPTKPVVTYSEEIEQQLTHTEQVMNLKYPNHMAIRWHAIKILENDADVLAEHPIAKKDVSPKNYEKNIIQAKYHYIEQMMKEVLFHKEEKEARTDKIDSCLMHSLWGVPIFLLIMGIVFFLTFTVGDFLKGGFEAVLDALTNSSLGFLEGVGASPVLTSLLVDGILGGVGGILTFIPNIAILFLALAILEDSGYMARVAYVMDQIMGKVGLSGKAFLPMILGFGCTVPALMATRALETEADRKKTMLVTPFMSCSARLPIYVLFSEMFFGEYKMLAAYSMYVIGLLLAIGVAFVLNKIAKGGANESLLIELPEYKKPNARTIRIYVWNKLKDYLTKAGTTIFIASIIIWGLLNFGMSGLVANPADSFGALFGKLLVPILAPAGLGMWQLGVALLAGLSAKEVVVSSLMVLFGVSNSGAGEGTQAMLTSIQQIDPTFGPVNAYAFMIFCLLYVPCAAAIGTVRKESNSMAFTLKSVLFQLGFAWAVSVFVFQIGSLLF